MLRVVSGMLLVLAVPAGAARAQVTITSGFDPADPWSLVLILPAPYSQAFIQPTAGNPGGFADMRPSLQNHVRAQVGFRWSQAAPVVAGDWSISIQADYKHFSGPPVDLLPFVLQFGQLHYPFANVITLGTSATWASTGTFAYTISELSNLSGSPLNLQEPVELGFFVRLQNPVPTTVASQVGIDNITLQLIPAPASMVPLVLLAHRRRRATCPLR